MNLLRTRIGFVALATATIIVGMIVHRGAIPLTPRQRDVLGDALWATMMYWWIGAALPQTRPLTRAGLALGISWAVELSQLYHTSLLDGWRQTTLGQLILGSGFDARDLVSYALGVVAGLLLERLINRRKLGPLRR